jgi:hypothetical protein
VPPSLTGSSLPSASSPNVSSWGSLLQLYEHGEPSEGFPVVDLSSGEEDAFPDTSRDEEIGRKLFRDINHKLFRLPNDDNMIVLSDSDEAEEVREDDCTDVEAVPSSTRDTLAPTASTSAAAADDAPDGVQNDSSGGSTLDRVQGDSSDSGDEASLP